MAKTLPSSAGSAGSIPGWGAKNPRRQKTKTENRKNIVTNSIKILKMVHIKKIFFKTEGFKIQKHREEGHVKMEPERGDSSHRPRKTISHQKLEETQQDAPLESLEDT